jgi:CheY-like chemotaxis protein
MAENSRKEPFHILLVEDSLAHAELVKRSFEGYRDDIRITHSKDGQAAIDFLFAEGECFGNDLDIPHIVLLDLRLPRVDGIEVLKRIKSDPGMSKIPVIVLTTSAAEKDVAMSYSIHANSYLVKPMEFDRFKQLMQDVGNYWLRDNQDPWDGDLNSSELDIRDLI